MNFYSGYPKVSKYERSPSSLSGLASNFLFHKELLQRFSVQLFLDDIHLKELMEYSIGLVGAIIDSDWKGETLSGADGADIDVFVNEFNSVASQFRSSVANVDSIVEKLNKDEARSRHSSIEKEFLEQLDEESAKSIRARLNALVPKLILFLEVLIGKNVTKNLVNYNAKIDGYLRKVKDIDELIVKVKASLDEVGMLPTFQGIRNYAGLFSAESKRFKDQARWWLIGIIVVLTLITLFAGMNFYMVYMGMLPNVNTNDIIQMSLSKLLILTTLLYFLGLSSKNYKSCKHNEVLNRHRETALVSFQAFVNSPSADDQTKNAVLIEATRAIFNSQQTGYVAGETEESPHKIVEIFKSFQGK
ncbi:hypothetical protein [Dyadobacter psychrotolerans]|uniref:Uncharacterized protein n=1 Tax=Dyadobacter psychrotolerans TaxID=2541721 RepID=A0A4R5DV15_9BACT|nr:hypothetical protein [Dyadobacter psychrotolerans]TDE16354.1 hypothetical protein E0F88_08890 [Dyadobacter psychrotolerans]